MARQEVSFYARLDTMRHDAALHRTAASRHGCNAARRRSERVWKFAFNVAAEVTRLKFPHEYAFRGAKMSLVTSAATIFGTHSNDGYDAKNVIRGADCGGAGEFQNFWLSRCDSGK
jgi:hypothetical protein